MANRKSIMASAAVAVAALVLAGCGDTLGEQAAIGAGAGAVTAAVLDGDVVAGAAVGAAGNALYCQQYPERCN
jgi:subtilisin family serine protease